MSVIIETSVGDITVDLLIKERPKCCFNFLKLCKMKFYNFCGFHRLEKDFIAQSGDPTGTGKGGHSVFAFLDGDLKKFFPREVLPKVNHTRLGTVSMVNNGDEMHGSQFFFTLREDLDYLDGVHTVFGYVVEGLETLSKMNELFYSDIIITHTVILEDPFDDPPELIKQLPDTSPEPTEEIISRMCITHNIEEKPAIDPKEQDSKAAATILTMLGDLPEEDIKPPDNVMFVCKLNPVTKEEDLEVIFGRFGPIVECEVIRDHKTGDSLQYAFIEFKNVEDCEKAYFKMDNVLIDDRRIHVDFSQSVAKYKWHRKSKKENSHFSRSDHNKSDHSKSDHSKSDHTRSDRGKSDHSRSDHSRAHHSRSDSNRTDHNKSAQTRSDYDRSHHSKSDQSRSDHSRSDHSRSDHSRSDYDRSHHSKFEQSRSHRSRSDSNRADHNKSAQTRSDYDRSHHSKSDHSRSDHSEFKKMRR